MRLPLLRAARAAAGKHNERPAQQFLPQQCWAGSALVPNSPQPQIISASWHGEPRQARCQLWHSPGLRNNPTTPGSFHIIYLSWSFFLLLSLHRHKLQSWLKKNMDKNSAAFATGYSIKYRFISICLHPAGYAGLIRNTGGGQTRNEGGERRKTE